MAAHDTELLVVDEVGLEQVERNEARRSGLMQKVLLPRYNHRRSTVITSNIAWESWGDYLGDHLGATALVDRMVVSAARAPSSELIAT